MQSIPIQAPLLYSNRENEILSFLFGKTKYMQCNLGVGTVAALLLKHYVMMKRTSVSRVQQTLFSGQSLSRANCIFEMPNFCLSIHLFLNIVPFFNLRQIVDVHQSGEAKSQTSCGSSLHLKVDLFLPCMQI